MRQQTRVSKEPAEKVVQDIRGAMRKHYSAEERSGSFWKACAARTALPSCVAARGSRRTCTNRSRRTSWRLERCAGLTIQPQGPYIQKNGERYPAAEKRRKRFHHQGEHV